MGCKVDALVERHGLTVPDPDYKSVDEFLVTRWTGSDGRSADGYKSLTEWFNRRILKRLYEVHGRDTVSVHLDREYEVITGDEGLDRDELGADLSADGLDIDDIDDEMVSWSTMRHHLKDCLDAKKDTAAASTDWEANTVQKAQEQAAEKTRSVLSSLTSKGRLPDAEQSAVEVQVKLSCPDCSVRVPFTDAIERGYVCETHLEQEPDEQDTDRSRNKVSGVSLSYAFVEAFQTGLSGESFLVETVAVAVL